MKGVIVFVIILIVTIIGCSCITTENEYLRIHIRADSNENTDQSIKYIIKDRIVEYLTPCVANCATKMQAMTQISKQLDGIKTVADQTLAEYGYDYVAKVKICKERFPARMYGDLVLDDGIYDAIIVELGSGNGDNWWCVVYPPLCFVGAECNGTNSIRYRSKLIEIIDNFCNAD